MLVTETLDITVFCILIIVAKKIKVQGFNWQGDGFVEECDFCFV